MKYEIRNCWTGAVQITAEIDCDETTTLGVKVGLAIRWALEHGANLHGADLSDADLRGANLRGANLCDAKGLEQFTILPAGVLTGYKKLGNGKIATLQIPAKAKRVNAYGSRKCRAEYAKVISGTGRASWDCSFKYAPGKIVRPVKPFEPDPRMVCASGIHFFITRQEAEDFQL